MVHVGLVGEWSDYGNFRSMDIWTREETGPEGKQWVTYAGCATSRGLVIFDLNSQSLSSYIPLCECNDLQIMSTNDGKATLAYVACGEKGLYIFNMDNPKVPYYLSLCDTPGKARGVAIEESYAYIADGESGLQIIDITHMNRPVIIGSCDTPQHAEGVAITDHYALIADGDGGLSIIDITHKQMPEIIGVCELSGYACDVATLDAYAYVASKEYGLQIIDISDKSEPRMLGHSRTPGSVRGVTLAGGFAYVADEKSGLRIIDISEKGNPLTIGGFMTPGGASDVSISGNYAYIAGVNGSLQSIDITTKTGPRVIGGCDVLEEAVDVFVAGDFAYVADRKEGIRIFDISDPNTPEPLGSFDIKYGAYGVCVIDNFAYAACRGGTLQIIDISDRNTPEIVKSCSTGLYSRQVFIDGNYAYVAVGNEQSFDINDLFNGLRIVDISDPNSAHTVGSLFTPGTAFDVETEGDYAFIADGVNGLQIINISDKSNPVFAGNCKIPGSAVSLAISGNYAYVAYWGAGFHIMDITDKNNPSIVGSSDFHGHATDVSVAGEYAFVTDADGGLRIFDISDPNAPVHLGNCGTPGSAQGIAIAGNHAFIADYDGGLQVIDIAEKFGPELIKKISHFYYASDVAILGDYAYVADPVTGLHIIDITQENGPVTVGSHTTPGYAEGLAVAGSYAYIADWDGGLQIIDISNQNEPVFAGNCVLPGYAEDVDVEGNYAYITDGDFHIVDISNKQDPQIVGNCDILMARYVAVAGDYAYVASSYTEGNDKISSLRIIDISDKNNPQIMGACDSPVYIKDMIIQNDYAYLADGNGGFQIIDIRDKTHPSPLGSCSTPGYADGIAIAGNHAYISDWGNGVQIIDISDPNTPKIVGNYDTPGTAQDIAIAGQYAYVADWRNGLIKIKIDTDFPSKGNLILMAGGGADSGNALWPATRAQTNHVFQTFINQGYESYDIWYINPVSYNDPDNDGIFNQLVVDDPTPTKAEFLDSIAEWAMGSPNQGPLYICLIGHGAEDRFQIMPNEVLSAWELKECIDRFRNGYVDNKGKVYEGTHRPVVVIIESAASGSFIDDLLSDGVTIITSTREGASYIKPDLFDSASPYSAPTPPGDQIRAFKSFTTILTHTLEPYLSPGAVSDEMYLRDAFVSAREVMQGWALDGLPFSDQAPQMAISGSNIISVDFSENGKTPLGHLTMDQNSVHILTILMKDTNDTYSPFPFSTGFFSSDPNRIAPEEIETSIDPNGIPWYEIKAKRNGNLILTGLPDPQDIPIFLSASVNIDVAIDDPEFLYSRRKKAVIVAGYKGSGDYLWESTNTIANHAYQTIRAMGYAKEDIFYYNPYLLQDLDSAGGYDEIRGYPLLNVLNPDSPYSAFNDIKQNGASELFLFFVDHGNHGSFCMNPSETLTCGQLTEWIAAIANHVEERIVFLYDACYSGSFLQEMEEDPLYTDSLAEKLLMITSTDPNQTAYYLNQGMVSFSYPFLDEWYLTHSIMDAFDYARQFLPHQGQTPLTSDTNIIISWDQERIYYVDESRPVIFDPNVSRGQGILRIITQAYSLTGISEVWAIAEVSHVQKDGGGRPVTDIPVISLSLDSDPNFPYGGSYSISIEDPYPHEPRYNLTLYAQDSSKRPKVASRKIAIGHKSEHKTVALILSSAPDLFPEYEREMLTTQLERAEAILKSKGLTEGEIKRINSLTNLEVPSLIEGQTLFVYLLGLIRLTDEGPRFFLNPNESISPETLEYILDPNQRHFILVEAPHAASFLSRINWQGKKNWAGAASTNKGNLFFSIGRDSLGPDYSPFPCFSNFFFSGILSGATVGQACRMAQNAVSLTRQMPVIFLPEGMPTNLQTMNRYLDYYLGMAAIPGEDYAILHECEAHLDDDQYVLTLSVQPHVQVNQAWVIMASPASFYQKSMIVDLIKDSEQDLIYRAEVPAVNPYYQVYFMAEGQIEGETDAGKNWTEWREISIAKATASVGEDAFEPDEDPNSIDLYTDHLLIVNALPEIHTFFCEETTQEGRDIDWVHFYAFKGHIYEIYTQDLSEYGYFIQMALYDPNIRPVYEHGTPLVSNNYIAFQCPEDGFYFLKAELASSYPQEGVEYIIGINDPGAADLTELKVEVKDNIDRALYIKGQMAINGVDIEVIPNISIIKYPDNHCFTFTGLPSYQTITIKVYEKGGSGSDPLAEKTVGLFPRSLNYTDIDLTSSSSPETFSVARGPEETGYYDMVPPLVLPSKLPYGDMDPNFFPEDDFDGDLVSNFDELLFYGTHAQYPTLTIPLHKGLNLFYFPTIFFNLCIIPEDNAEVFHYDMDCNSWGAESDKTGQSNTFNAIRTNASGMLYLDLREISTPVIYLKGFIRPGYTPESSYPNEYLDTQLLDPSHLDPNCSTFEILNHPDFDEIESVSSRSFCSGAWCSSYRFFGRPGGKDTRFCPYDIHVLQKGK